MCSLEDWLDKDRFKETMMCDSNSELFNLMPLYEFLQPDSSLSRVMGLVKNKFQKYSENVNVFEIQLPEVEEIPQLPVIKIEESKDEKSSINGNEDPN